jgi:GT2 family glycosyltransferase
MNVAIVTPWLDHTELMLDYGHAVAPVIEPDDEVIIIDNCSDPYLIFSFNGLRIIRSETSLGFAGASNLGLHAAESDAVLFLNNDIEMIRPDWLDRIRAALAPGVLVGAQLRSDPHASVDGERFPYLDGWCVAGMRDDLLDLGGFDETLDEPAYYSDNLLSLEARAAGMTLLEVAGGLRHKLNQTAKTNPNVRAATLANQARYQARVRELTVTV